MDNPSKKIKWQDPMLANMTGPTNAEGACTGNGSQPGDGTCTGTGTDAVVVCNSGNAAESCSGTGSSPAT